MGAAKLDNGLTIQENKFVREIVRHGNAIDAASVAYPKAKRLTQQQQASRLMKRPRVVKSIKKRLDEIGADDSYVAKNLKTHVEDGIGKNANAQTSLKALELMIKVRESVKKTQARSVHFHLIQRLDNNNKHKILDKRNELNNFFSSITEAEEE